MVRAIEQGHLANEDRRMPASIRRSQHETQQLSLR
jgi:hypothetical protein